MTFRYPADQVTLWEVLSINEREELLQDRKSLLYCLMADIDAFDIQNKTNISERIKLKVLEYKDVEFNQSELLAGGVPLDIIEETVEKESSVKYRGMSENALYKRQKREIVQQILNLLDSCGCLANKYLQAKVIAT